MLAKYLSGKEILVFHFYLLCLNASTTQYLYWCVCVPAPVCACVHVLTGYIQTNERALSFGVLGVILMLG